MLARVKCTSWSKEGPLAEQRKPDAVLNTEDVSVAIRYVNDEGVEYTRVYLRDGSQMFVEGHPDQFLPAGA